MRLRLIAARTPADGNPLPLRQVVPITDALERRGPSVAAGEQPRQFLDCNPQVRQLVHREKFRIVRMRATMLAAIRHETPTADWGIKRRGETYEDCTSEPRP